MTLAGLILGALLWSRLAPAPTRPVTGRPTRLAIEIPADQELVHAEISRDGRMVAYVARPRRVGESSEGIARLYLRPLEANQARVVPDTDRVDWATFSPDGRWLAYYARDPQGFLGKLKKIAVEGGPAVTLLSDTRQAWGALASWREDDRLLMDHVGSLVMLSADGGEPETILPEEAFSREVILGTLSVPGTTEVLLTVGYQDEGSLRLRGEVVSLSTGERRLLRDNFGPVFLRDGILIARTLEGFVVTPFDVERLEVEGSAVPLFSWDYSVSLSDNGTLLMYWDGFETRLPVVVDREGEVTDLPGLGSVFNGGAAVRHIRWSPDGQRFAMTVHDSELRSQIFTYDVPSGALTRLNFPGYYADEVAWSPDGESIAFTATSSDSGYNLFVRSATGSDTPELLIEASSHDEPADWSPDGSTILFNRHHEQGSDVFALDLTRGDASPPLATPAWEHSPRFSPDGKWVALVSDEAGQHEVYVVRYTGAGGEGNPRKFRASANGGDHPKWAPEGNTLYFVTPNEALTAVTVDESDDGEQLRFGAARDIFTLANMAMASNGPHAYDPHPDGARFALISIQEPEDASKNLQVVLNWFAELEQKLEPAN